MPSLTTVSAILFLIILTCIKLNVFGESTCSESWFDCGNGKCIADIWRCDGDNDCGNMADEKHCENGHAPLKCLSSQFQCHGDHHCIPETWHCDGEHDCDDESDEKDCENSTECNGFRCKDNHCIPERWKCDGQKDCADGSDEELCPNAKVCSEKEFTCLSGSCINMSKVCDGKKDCMDASDEGKHCSDLCKNANCSDLCRSTPSGPECYCHTGFKLNKDNRTCSDINECIQEELCSHRCENKLGSYKCSCLEGYELVNGTCLAKGSEPLLIFSTLQEIRGLYLRSRRYFLIKSVYRAAAVDMDPSDRRIYWAEISNISSIYSSKIDGSSYSVVLNHGLQIPEDIAVDYVGRNLYITDSGLNQVLVCKLDGTMCSVLHENTGKPRSLALDPVEGLLYWSDWGENTAGIYRSGMDGSRLFQLVFKDIKWPNGIAIDHTVNRLYWADGKLHTIEYITLDGKDRKVLLKERVYHPYSLTVFEDTLYWTDWNTFSLESCNKFTGHRMTLQTRENGKHIMGVHVYHSVLATTTDDPCWSNMCSHMCVIAPQKSFRCMCPVGFLLSSDGRTCSMDNKFPSLFVSEDSKIYHLRPGTVKNGSVTELPLYHLGLISRVDYDWKSKTLFVSDLKVPAIYAINMETLIRRELVKTHLVAPQDIAFDWINNNLYWTDWSKGTVEVVSVSSLKTSVVVENLSKPTALAVSPIFGFLFVSTVGDEPSVTMYDMDGKNSKPLSRIVGLAMSLALHPSKSLIFWADPNLGTISYIDYLDLDSLPIVRKSGVGNVISIAVSENYLYWTETKSRQLNVLKENNTHSNALSLPGLGSGQVARKITYSTVPSFDRQSNADLGQSHCLRNNGNCSHICVSAPKGKLCICPTGMIVSNDTTTCIEKECKKDEFRCEKSKRCIPSEYFCDGSKDCDDGSDERCEEPFSRCPGNDFKCRNGRCIISSWKCDRRNDCGDNSDEENCPIATSCAKDQFSCGNGECIPSLWRCDGENDCNDSSDEKNCHETVCNEENQLRCDHGQCIPMSWVCDGTPDCFDSTDEKNCTKEKQCSEKEYQCHDGTCIDKSMRCDKRTDCDDGSDERNCAHTNSSCKVGHFQCKDGMCIYDHEVCDGYKDCLGGEEEINCTRTDCTHEEYFCNSSKHCIPRRWICDGDVDCPGGADEIPEICITPQKLPPAPAVTADQCEDFYCYSSKECLPWFKVCDGKNDCENLPDEGGLCSKACTGNGGCAQMCRSTPQGARCSCFSGFSLLNDGKTCEDINECLIPGTCSHFCNNTKGGFKCSCSEGYFIEHHRKCKADGGLGTLVYLLPDEIRGIDLGPVKGSRHQRIYVSSSEADMKGMDYDSSGIFYWSDWKESTINSYTPDSNRQDIILHTRIKPNFLKWDWLARNFYYTDDEGSIVACRADGKYCATLIQWAVPFISGIDISPQNGLMFWGAWNSVLHKNNGVVERAEMDGSHRMSIVSERIIWPTAVTVDQVMKLVFWIDTKLNVLESTDFHGLHRKLVISVDMYYPFSMTIFEDNVFWADWGTDSIISCEKFNGKSCHVFHSGNVKSETMTVVHKVKQAKGGNRCKESNCEHMCLPTLSSFVCKCDNDYVMRNSTCELKPKSSAVSPKPRESCPDNYCLQGARCVVVGGKYFCQCPYPFDGDKCEKQFPGTHHVYDYSWIVAVCLAILLVAGIVLAVFLFKDNRKKLSKVSERVAVKFRNPVFRRKSGRLVVDTDDGGACDELMLGSGGAYKQSGFGNPLFGKKPIMVDPEAQDGDFKRWPSYDSNDSAFVSESQTRDGSELGIGDTAVTKTKASEKIVQFFRKL